MGKCFFCKQPAGFLLDRHSECEKKANEAVTDIKKIVESFNRKKLNYSQAKDNILQVIEENEFYQIKIQGTIWDHELLDDETVIYAAKYVCITESKNRCKMERTGLSYESRAHTRSKDSNLKRNTDKKRSCQYRRLLSKTTQAKATCFETKLNRVVPNGMLCGVRGRN